MTGIKGVVVGSVATILPDGRPWNTPLHMAFDDTHVYWMSRAETTHSTNIVARSAVSITIWSPDVSTGLKGVYIQSEAAELQGDEAEAARAVYKKTFGQIPRHLNSASVYAAPIGAKDTTRSWGGIQYYSITASTKRYS